MELTVQQAYETALGFQRAGRPADAEAVYRQILNAAPSHAPTILNLAHLCYQSARADDAAELMRRAIALDPQNANLLGNLGTIYASAQRLDDAIATFSQAIALQPNIPALHDNLGNALQAKGRYAEAIDSYRRAITLMPTSAEAYNNLGAAYTALDRKDEAIAAFRQALALQPNHVQAMNNLGTALSQTGRIDESIELFNRAMAIDPNFTGVYHNLGNSYREAGMLDEAIASYRKAAAHGTNPGAADDLLIAVLLHPRLSREQVWQEHVQWDRTYARPLAPAGPVRYANDRDPNRRLRIGYLSPDFSEHPVGRFFLPLMLNHDRAGFEVVCYSDTRRPDGIAAQLRRRADLWRETLGASDEHLARLVRDDRIDVLVDLAMHTRHNRLLAFARKPAPVQATYLAYPGTTGLSVMDYRVTDPYLDPPGSDPRFCSEKAVLLARSYWCYQPHRQAPPVNALPALSRGGAVTFGCLNVLGKMNPGTFDLWSRILAKVPHARVLLYCFDGSPRARVLSLLAAGGVDASRVEFVARTSPAEYFAHYHQIDVALDTFPFPGGTTTCDALWMGVPVVTLAGNTPLARGGVSILSNVGLPELIAQTPDDYVNIAAALATDLPRLAQSRATLRDRMSASPLMDAPRFAKDVEAALRTIWRNWCAGP